MTEVFVTLLNEVKVRFVSLPIQSQRSSCFIPRQESRLWFKTFGKWLTSTLNLRYTAWLKGTLSIHPLISDSWINSSRFSILTTGASKLYFYGKTRAFSQYFNVLPIKNLSQNSCSSVGWNSLSNYLFLSYLITFFMLYKILSGIPEITNLWI
jgi:hypothetical protein